MKTEKRINNFIELISNIMEAYTVILFLADEKNESVLKFSSYCSLSRSLKKKCTIVSGEGIVGWVLKENKPVLASHFDKRDATTLKFYEKDENIKSLIAIPLPKKYGVLYVDSKKSYIFTEEKEKILIQMSQVLLSILKSEKEIKEKKLLEFLLTFSLNANELLSSNVSKNIFVEDFLHFFCDKLHLHSVIFVVEDEAVYWCSLSKRKSSFEKMKYDYFDKYGFAGWVLKNKKELYLDNISSSDKSFIINKKERFSDFKNFLGFPLSYKNRGKNGAMCFVKRNKEKWLVKEKKTVEFINQLFFKEYFNKK